jgi:2Fe-2S ferredoxin
MGKIVYVTHAGEEHAIEASDGTSVMQAAMTNNIVGIVAECGGSMMCATCHVYVRDPWLTKLKPIDATQEAMLTMTASERKPSSRLSCQILMSPALDGITVDLPEHQV